MKEINYKEYQKKVEALNDQIKYLRRSEKLYRLDINKDIDTPALYEVWEIIKDLGGFEKGNILSSDKLVQVGESLKDWKRVFDNMHGALLQMLPLDDLERASGNVGSDIMKSVYREHLEKLIKKRYKGDTKAFIDDYYTIMKTFQIQLVQLQDAYNDIKDDHRSGLLKIDLEKEYYTFKDIAEDAGVHIGSVKRWKKTQNLGISEDGTDLWEKGKKGKLKAEHYFEWKKKHPDLFNL